MKRMTGISFQKIITIRQLLTDINMTEYHTVFYRIFLLPNDTILIIYHLQIQCLTLIGECKRQGIQLISFKPKVFSSLINTFTGLEIDKLGRKGCIFFINRSNPGFVYRLLTKTRQTGICQ